MNNQLYQYADNGTSGTATGSAIDSASGTDSTPVAVPLYGDNDGQDLISFLWTPPVIHLPGRRFANKRYEIVCDYPSSFVLKDQNNVSLMITGDLRKTFSLQDDYQLQFKGDSLGETPLVNPDDVGPNPNDPNADALGFRLDEPYAFVKGRLKFLSSSFSVTLTGSTLSGPLVFNKIRLFGIAERNA